MLPLNSAYVRHGFISLADLEQLSAEFGVVRYQADLRRAAALNVIGRRASGQTGPAFSARGGQNPEPELSGGAVTGLSLQDDAEHHAVALPQFGTRCRMRAVDESE